MNVIALIEDSDGQAYPGHMVIGVVQSRLKFYGYRFDPDDIPDGFRQPIQWRDYLFDNTVPGHIVDESNYVNALVVGNTRNFVRKEWAAVTDSSTHLPERSRWSKFALYSFNPDDFVDCYNCVSWATKVITDLVPNALAHVRQGRVKLMVIQLRSLTDSRDTKVIQ